MVQTRQAAWRITHRELNFFRLLPLSISSEQSDLLIRVVPRELFRPCFRGGKAFFITKRGTFHHETTVITHCSSDTPSYAYFSGDAFSIYLGYGDAYSSFSRYDCRCYCSSFSRLEMERSGENDGKWSVACASCNIYPLDHWNDHWYVDSERDYSYDYLLWTIHDSSVVVCSGCFHHYRYRVDHAWELIHINSNDRYCVYGHWRRTRLFTGISSRSDYFWCIFW